jgi:predicted nucleotidyltransferase
VTEPETPLDAERILRALAEHEVDYVLIGGLAVQTHGHVRTTNDADLIPAPDPSNLERLAAALRSLEARVLNPGEEETAIDSTMLPTATIWQFASRDGGIDVMHEIPDGRSYDELSKGALHVQLGDVDVPVVGLDDLIQMKLARGRPVDLADVASLTDPAAEP